MKPKTLTIGSDHQNYDGSVRLKIWSFWGFQMLVYRNSLLFKSYVWMFLLYKFRIPLNWSNVYMKLISYEVFCTYAKSYNHFSCLTFIFHKLLMRKLFKNFYLKFVSFLALRFWKDEMYLNILRSGQTC